MKPPSFRILSVFLVMLSLSIGWGIRGNYGHEAGAMIPGALAAIAAALMSGREDWRRRVPYFAFFGALGWAFGGSISYMHPPSYTETGELATQVYGFLSTFFEAFLWAALGGAATAYAAVEERENLTAIFRPLLWVFGILAIQYVIQDTPFGFEDGYGDELACFPAATWSAGGMADWRGGRNLFLLLEIRCMAVRFRSIGSHGRLESLSFSD